MIMVSIGTFSWSSLRLCRVLPSETAVMLTTVYYGVESQLSNRRCRWDCLSAVFFSRKIAKVVFVDTVLSPDEFKYSVAGQIFFVSVDEYRSIRFQRRAGASYD